MENEDNKQVKKDYRLASAGSFPIMTLTKSMKNVRKGWAFINYFKINRRYVQWRLDIKQGQYKARYKLNIRLGTLKLLLDRVEEDGRITITKEDRRQFRRISGTP